MQLTGRIISVTEVDERQREQMFALMQRYYLGMNQADFETDLREKQWVIQVVDEVTDRVVGFSTQMLIDQDVEGRSVRALFSGDTIVDQQFWGNNTLTKLRGRLALDLINDAESIPLYWFLITKGYATYRLLPVFFREFYPRFDRPTPPSIVQLIDVFAGAKYPQHYDSATGVVRSGEADCCRLRAGVADVSDQRLADPHIQFFTERNPGHADGEELCCLAPLTPENFTRAAWRIIDRPAVLPVAK